jgi:hypothetical protein
LVGGSILLLPSSARNASETHLISQARVTVGADPDLLYLFRQIFILIKLQKIKYFFSRNLFEKTKFHQIVGIILNDGGFEPKKRHSLISTRKREKNANQVPVNCGDD